MYLCVLFTIILWFGTSIHIDMMNNDQYSVIRSLITFDREGVADMRQYLLDLKEQGKTILIASHSFEDIDILCDTVSEMDKGVLKELR